MQIHSKNLEIRARYYFLLALFSLNSLLEMFSCQYSASPKNPSNNVSPTVYAATCVCINRFAEDNMSVQPQQGQLRCNGKNDLVRLSIQNALSTQLLSLPSTFFA